MLIFFTLKIKKFKKKTEKNTFLKHKTNIETFRACWNIITYERKGIPYFFILKQNNG